MKKTKLNIVVACGSGIATSTIAADGVEEILKERGIGNYSITKTSMTELPGHIDGADVILTTNNYKTDEKPSVNVMAFVTGINADGLKEKLGELFTELTNK